jgi:DNA polymerase-1
MEKNGVPVDVNMMQEAQINITNDIATLEDNIQNIIQPNLGIFTKWFLDKEFPVKNSGEFAQKVALIGALDLPKTETGRFSFASKNIEALPDSQFKSFLLGTGNLDENVITEAQRLCWKDMNLKHMFNLSSKHHLKILFFETLMEKPINKTDLGNPQVDDLFLSVVAKKYEWVALLQQFNRLNKLKGTYIDRLLTEQKNGIFYPRWFMHGTTSGRLSGDLMQLPRKMEEGEDSELVVRYNNMMREFIISGTNRKLVGADYASLEVVVFADDAGDEPLLNMIRNDEDFYSKTAIDIHNLRDKYSANKKADNFLKKHQPTLRQEAKIYSLGIRYNMQSFKLSKELNISQKAAEKIINSYFESYPKLKTRMDELINQALTKGYVKSKGGRVRHLALLPKLHYSHGEILSDSLALWKKYHEIPKKYEQIKYLAKQYNNLKNNALNFPIQSMAATITNKASIAMTKEFKRQNLDASICRIQHDEVVLSCSKKRADRVAKIMKYTMENTTKLSVPLNADPEVGERYGEIK